MNVLDSSLVENLLFEQGFEITGDRNSADIIIYNTCSVRAHAEQKVFSSLGKDAKRKASLARENSPGTIMVGVIGCMAQRLGQKLKNRYKVIDFICAPGRLHQLPEIIRSASKLPGAVYLDPPRTRSALPGDNGSIELLDSNRKPCGSRHAYLRIMRGCDRFCGYCIVPFVRGPERSRKPASIIQEARKLVDAGCDYITLLGQTVNSYHSSYQGKNILFADLLYILAGITGLRRLDFITSHPAGFNQDILTAMKDLDSVCPYIHCPPQSGSDRILKAMNRGYTRSEYDALVDSARRIVPEVTLAGDFIVGFPGESERDHEMSIDLIRQSGFKNSFIFKYSPRPGTQAAKKYADNVPEEVKKMRNNELLAVQKEVGLECHRRCVGRRFEVYVEGPSPRCNKQENPPTPDLTQMRGRTRGNHIVLFYSSENIADQYVDVEITGASDLGLVGKQVSHSGPSG